jgi:hypothetical protein
VRSLEIVAAIEYRCQNRGDYDDDLVRHRYPRPDRNSCA